MKDDNCYLNEIYSAIQGEGPLVGIRQIFIRFSICDLRCVWCDTPLSLIKNEFCKTELSSGTRQFEQVKNPINVSQLLSLVKNLSPNIHHSISLTGGEPLLQYKFIEIFLAELKNQLQVPIYLESGGHRPTELKQIIKLLDYVSMDFKLPSSAKTGTFWDKHKEFLNISLSSTNIKRVWVKIVVTSDTLFDDVLTSINIVKSLNKDLEIILQPVTQINGSKPPSEQEILNIQSKALREYPFVRVLPQVHKLIGQM